jgi:hypothetical protein
MTRSYKAACIIKLDGVQTTLTSPVSKKPVANDSFSDLKSAGEAFLERARQDVCRRMAALFPGADEELVLSATRQALKRARRDGGYQPLCNASLRQAMRTTVRHELLAYEKTLKMVGRGGRVSQELYKCLKPMFCEIAKVVTEALANPRQPEGSWPPKVAA